MTKNIYVFEQNVPEGSGLYPAEAISTYLPKCDVVVITATSIINHTFDEVSSYCKNAKEVCLVGPSTPLCPEIFLVGRVTFQRLDEFELHVAEHGITDIEFGCHFLSAEVLDSVRREVQPVEGAYAEKR
jgi:uncharacterized protein (DUF4213/DUF364 family)